MYQAQQLLRSKIRKSVLIDDDEPMHTEQATGYRSGGHHRKTFPITPLGVPTGLIDTAANVFEETKSFMHWKLCIFMFLRMKRYLDIMGPLLTRTQRLWLHNSKPKLQHRSVKGS